MSVVILEKGLSDVQLGQLLNAPRENPAVRAKTYATAAAETGGRHAHSNGALYRVALSDGGEGNATFDVTGTVKDRFGNTVAEKFEGEMSVEAADAYDDTANQDVFYKLSIVTGDTLDSSKADGSPTGGGRGKFPSIGFRTDANGIVTVRISRVRLNGTTEQVGTGDVDVRFKLKVQSEFVSWAEMKNVSDFDA